MKHSPLIAGAALALVLGLSGCGRKKGATDNTTSDGPMQKPATVEQATQVLDLSTLPLMDGAKPERARHMAHLTYAATGDVKAGFDFHRKALTAQGWKELPNSSVTEQSASAMFARSGFVLSLSILSSGKSGDLSFMLQNHGNIKPGQLPVPPGAKSVYVGDSTAMYATEAAVPATAEACRNLLLAQGWVPYGGAGDSAEFKQNAIVVTATTSVAPAQGGKTMIQYSTQLIFGRHSRAAERRGFALRRRASGTHLRHRAGPECRGRFLPKNSGRGGLAIHARSHRPDR